VYKPKLFGSFSSHKKRVGIKSTKDLFLALFYVFACLTFTSNGKEQDNAESCDWFEDEHNASLRPLSTGLPDPKNKKEQIWP
jgi:hypothetical protein